MMQQKQSKLRVLWMNIVALTIGIPSPYGRLRPQLFFTMKQLNDEVNSLRERYDYALKVNERQDTRLKAYHAGIEAYIQDNKEMQAALKDLAYHFNEYESRVLSHKTQDLLKSLRGANEQKNN